MPNVFMVDCDACGVEYDSWSGGHLSYCDVCESDYCPDDESVCHDSCCCRPTSYASPSEERTVFNYSYRPRLNFHGHGDYFLGVELEVTAQGSSRYDAGPIYAWANDNDAPGLFFVKEDGSVEGFEIVTHPMTPEFFEGVDWEGFFDMLNDQYPTGRAGNREPSGHGIHVHVSRSAFPSTLTLARWSYLVNRHSEHVERVARRAGSQWARFTRTPVREVLSREAERTGTRFEPRPNATLELPIWACGNADCPGYHEPDQNAFTQIGRWCYAVGYNRSIPNPEFEAWQRRQRANGFTYAGMLRRHALNAVYSERYSALNMLNSDTVEVRVFRSTRRATEFRDAIRLVYSSVEYVRSMQPCHTTSIRDALSWAGYCAFVAAQYELLYPTVAGMTIGNPNRRPRERDALGRFTATRDGAFTAAA